MRVVQTREGMVGGHFRQGRGCAKGLRQERAGCAEGVGSRPLWSDYKELRIERWAGIRFRWGLEGSLNLKSLSCPWLSFTTPGQFFHTTPNCRCLVAKCLTLCNPMDCSLPGSSVHGILQARILEWVAISSSRRSS